ncbi:MAG: bifunctional pyr operon transcriptional regulator/uracil phosphoribosyltransferase PyrR [Bacteroidia bacterium]|nr:bifunctional pyr operon transcriptional regulator/uracil phosphoribosyltransferase PyrR [Bacteroidia bacterium]MDW8133631.1 bifunctional pyr operon transcriptional regulator/uracil phosphoribosyltransferase PyrR [Bacteroidia bacterium]
MERLIAEGGRIQLTLRRIASQIAESAPVGALVGIEPRGVILAEVLQIHLEKLLGEQVPLGKLDVTFWRDDLRQREKLRVPRPTWLPFPIENHRIWLVDDVIYTGRTARAALDALQEFGRPASIRLAVLVERRGLREVPIVPDCVGFVLDTIPEEKVLVHLFPQPSIRIVSANA